SPRASSHSTTTSPTSAPRGPRRHQSTIDSTRASSPSKTASTVPSALLRIQPETPSEQARSRAVPRKKTPWTRPETTTCARLLVEALLADERHEPAGDGAQHRRPLGAAHVQLEPLLRAHA